jgi:hypothetical protein
MRTNWRNYFKDLVTQNQKTPLASRRFATHYALFAEKEVLSIILTTNWKWRTKTQ